MPTYHSPSSSPSPPPRSRTRSRSTRPRRRGRTPSPATSYSPPRSPSLSYPNHRPASPYHFSPTPSPSPSRSVSRSPSRSPSRASSRSPSRSRTQRLKDKFPDDGLSEEKSESIVKTSLVFLGAVGAATLAAHKFWPKGITYGEKEEWECIKKEERRAKRAERDAREGRGGGGERGGYEGREGDGERRRRGGERRADDGRYVAGAGAAGVGGAAAGYAGSSAPSSGSGRDRGGYPRDERNGGRGGGYYAREEVVVRDRSIPAAELASRSRSRQPSREHRDGAGTEVIVPPTAAPVVVERRTGGGTRRDVEYYPSEPVPRAMIEPSRTRARSVVYDDEPGVVYVRRDQGGGSRYSVSAAGSDGRARSRYGDDYDR